MGAGDPATVINWGSLVCHVLGFPRNFLWDEKHLPVRVEMFRGMRVYKGNTLAEKTAILPSQVRMKIEYIMAEEQGWSIDSASIILAELCGVLLGLRRAEFFASAEKKPNQTTLLCFRNLAGLG